MSGERIRSVNEGLPQLHQTLAADPVVSEKAWLSVVSFSTDAVTHLPLTRVDRAVSMPTLRAGGQTNYAVGLHHIGERIESDVKALRRENVQVIRPCVFFVTDGRPGDAWKTKRDLFVDRTRNPLAPNIIAFGVANADREILLRLCTRFALMSQPGVNPTEALKEVLGSMANSIVASTTGAAPQLLIRAGSAMTLHERAV
jgi:uncharacterized protein YegL